MYNHIIQLASTKMQYYTSTIYIQFKGLQLPPPTRLVLLDYCPLVVRARLLETGLFCGTLWVFVGLAWALPGKRGASFGSLWTRSGPCAVISDDSWFSQPGADFSGPLLGHLLGSCGPRKGPSSRAESAFLTLALAPWIGHRNFFL